MRGQAAEIENAKRELAKREKFLTVGFAWIPLRGNANLKRISTRLSLEHRRCVSQKTLPIVARAGAGSK